MKHRWQGTLTLLLAALVGACGGGDKKVVAPGGGDGTGGAVAPGPGADKPVVDEGPTAEDTLAWVLATVASGQVEQAEVERRFSPGFLKQVPAAQVVQIFAALKEQLPPVTVLKQDGTAPLKLAALLDTAAGGLRVSITMTSATPRQIDGLLFAPATSEAPPRTYPDAVAQLEKAGAKAQLFVAEVDQGACVPKLNVNTTTSLATGSTFKLWVLLALDEKLATSKGKLTWDTTLPIRDEAKSLPSGTMQDEAAGTTHTLREFATQMISISDNTATDHLIDYVGDAGVEKALKLAKHTNPAANTPFLRTRELFGLKLAASPEDLAGYRKASVAAKRKMLATMRTAPIDLTRINDWMTGTPRALDLEWFADGRDLCNVMATLGTRGKWDPTSPLLTILSKNPGLPFDAAQWSYLGFKGGSEPGVMNLTFLGKRSDGKWFVVVAAVNDDAKGVDESLVVNAATGVLRILGAEAAPAAP
ncbi:MAG: serine hydrolase [Kofleriaceae bacterium]